MSVLWIGADKLVRDGDEEGHVGAAELFRGDLLSGDWIGFLERLWLGPMGEYPQAFTAVLGFWWWLTGVGQPSEVVVRSICLLSLAVAGLATARMARRFVPDSARNMAEVATFIAVLALPLGNGLSRHFMPEGALMAVVAVALLLALRLVERPSWSRAFSLGVAIGLGVLTKQTFVFFVFVPLMFILKRMLPKGFLHLGVVLLVSAAVAAPWLFQNGTAQISYGLASAIGHGAGGVWDHLEFYPMVLLMLGLGPFLSVAVGLALWRLCSVHDKRALWLGLAWFVGGLVLLTLLPKKYPRLIAPLLPGIALWLGVGVARTTRPHPWLLALGIGSMAWLAAASTVSLPLHPNRPAIDPGCTQVWVRPPNPDDFGLSVVETHLRNLPEGPVLVLRDLEIPCGIQTTHNWSHHLSPWLRRAGAERAIVMDAAQHHIAVIDGLEGPGKRIDVPSLDGSLYIRDSLKP